MFIEHVFGKKRPSLQDLDILQSFSNEDDFLEFKEQISDDGKNFLNAIVAFANARGGLLILGISDIGHKIVGIKEDENYIDNKISSSIEPSLAGIYNIFEIKVDDKRYVQLIEVGFSAEIHAVMNASKENSQKHDYTYYVRSGQSSRKMTPSDFNRIASIKKDYRYNFEYRFELFKQLNTLIRNFLIFFNFNRKDKLSEDDLRSIVTDYLKQREDEAKLKHDFIKVIEQTKLEFLYRDIQSSVADVYLELFVSRNKVPHDKLTFEEDKLLNEVFDIINSVLGLIDVDIKIDKIKELRAPRISSESVASNQEGPTLKSFIKYMFEYLHLSDDENKRELNLFVKYLENHDGFFWSFKQDDGGHFLTIQDMDSLFRGYFQEHKKQFRDLNVLYEKIEIRKEQFMMKFSCSIAELLMNLLSLRDLIYENLLIPISRNADDDEINKYRRSTFFVHY